MTHCPELESEDNQSLVAELLRFESFDELCRSESYEDIRSQLEAILDRPRFYGPEFPIPRLASFLRVIEWNIERGSMLEPIIEVLNNHPVLRWADVLLLNELDIGMARSGNLNIASELARRLSARAVFGAEYLELTKGTADELGISGENTTALHGNAVLTRYPVSNPLIVRLPRCENNFESAERRIGGRIGILIDVDAGGRRFVIANTHLDVVNSPRCRARQIRAMLRSIDERANSTSSFESGAGRAIVGGDFNTHTFSRGGQIRAMKNTALILGQSRHALERRLRHPELREPAITELSSFGYEVGSLNDEQASSSSIVSKLDDSSRLPRPMKWWVNRRVPAQGLLLEFRLDWLASRGVRVLKAGEVIDPSTGVTSIDPVTIRGLRHDGRPLSDHDPIVADISPGITHCEPNSNQSD
jgi:endonuclease/exonuclease/phosphatase family metal-dependent hydrolase